MPELKIGSSDLNTNGEVTPWQQWFQRYARSYAPPVDGYVGNADDAAIRLLQSKLGIVVDGIFGDRTAARVGYKWKGQQTPPVVKVRRPIWMYTAPGSGAPGDVGPSYQLGNRCRDVLNINHQWIGYPIGGYLGLMGGDSKLSYNDVIRLMDLELERLLDLNPDLQAAMTTRRADPRARVAVELWFSAYSQSADGMRRSVNRLFGPGGKYELVRDRINGLILFGDPGTPGTGIARTSYDLWLERLVREINYENDFYAVAPDAIRPAFYKVITEAETELPFFVHVLQIAVPVILNNIIPVFGGFFGQLGALAVGATAGLGNGGDLNLLGMLMGQAGTKADQDTHDDLVQMLSITGLIKNLPGLIGLIGALPGLQAHGGYEFDPYQMNRAYDVVAGFRR